MAAATATVSAVRKGFVSVDGRLAHYRTAGSGPPVVLLHDSPRSSALHLPLLDALSGDFTVIALDTPGYGRSEPLPGGPFEISDFSAALAATLDALGIDRAGFYGFHTSSKILLDFAVSFPERVSLAILDGLSIPPGGPDLDYIDRYMRPFELDEDGAYIAREWTRLRDSGRWFPWFDRRPETRIVGSSGTPAQLHQSLLDYFSAGPHYADAYRAAMLYRAAPKLAGLTTPTVIMARSDDVLFGHLELLPRDLPVGCAVERLGPAREAWSSRIRALFRAHAGGNGRVTLAPAQAHRGSYIDLAFGQVRLWRFGGGDRTPILYLHEAPGGGSGAERWLRDLARERLVLAPDLPGCGGSDPLPAPTADAYAAALEAVIAATVAGPVDMVAEATSTPLALRLMNRAPRVVRRAVLDAVLLPEAEEGEILARSYAPPMSFDPAGAYLHRAWHMVRDQAVQWPWFDTSAAGVRRFQGPIDAVSLHRRLLDVLTQLDHYGDAARAAFEHDARSDMAGVRAPVLVLDSEDRRDQWARTAAQLCATVQTAQRPSGPEALTQRILAYLDAP